MIVSERRLSDRVERSTRYYISSLPGDAKGILHAKRAHWRIENSLHWVLDMALGEKALSGPG